MSLASLCLHVVFYGALAPGDGAMAGYIESRIRRWRLYGRRRPGVRYSERACSAWSYHNHRRPSPMTKLQSNEQRLTGSWIAQDGKVHGDAICERIKWLLAHDLQKVADSPQWGAWETLYRDPDDGRYWERTYPQSELHGGGPPELRVLTADEAKQKYGSQVV